jgi:Zn-dependent M28 family amino/carboxypeptidase
VLEQALRRHVETLTVEIGPRAPGLGGSLPRTAAYIRSVLDEAGLSVAEQPYDFFGEQVVNLIAAPPAIATAPAFYVVGAHYDSVPSTPGADDNASAVAVLLELARRLPQLALRAPVRLVAFTMEEPPAFTTGLQGSRIFVKACQAAGERVAGAIVLEMVGYTAPRQIYPPVLRFAGYPREGNFIGIVGNWRSRPFGRAVLRGFRKNPRLPVESLFVPFDGRILPATRLSDHASFWDARLPAVMVTDTAFFRNPHYHLPTDTIDTLDFAFMAGLVDSLALALTELPPIQ